MQASQKTWSVSAEAYNANARDFGISTPKFCPPAIMQWHLNHEGPKLSFSSEQEFTQDPLVLVPAEPVLALSSPNGLELTQDPLVPIHELSAQPGPSPNLVGSVAIPSGDGPS